MEISRGPFSALVGASSAAPRTTTLLGIVSAVVGGFVGRLLGLSKEGEPAGFIGALLGAILLLWIYRKTRKPAAA